MKALLTIFRQKTSVCKQLFAFPCHVPRLEHISHACSGLVMVINRESWLGFTYYQFISWTEQVVLIISTPGWYTGRLNSRAAHSIRLPLTGSLVDDKNIASMSKRVHLCLSICRLCYLTLSAPAIKAQRIRLTLMPLMLFNHSTIHHSMP